MNAQSSGPDPAVFDSEQFRNNLESDELMKTLIDLFSEESESYLTQAEVALEQQDGEALHRAAHALKGLLGNYAAERALEKASHMVKLAKESSLEQAEGVFTDCREEIENLHAALIDFGKALE